MKPKELTRGEPDACVRDPFPRVEIALAKPFPSHIVSGRQAEGGREKAARNGKWLVRWELKGRRKLANFANGLGEGAIFAKGGRFSDGRAGLGILPARVDRRVRGAAGGGRIPSAAGLPRRRGLNGHRKGSSEWPHLGMGPEAELAELACLWHPIRG